MRFHRLITLYLLWAGMVIDKIRPDSYAENTAVGLAFGLLGAWVFQPKNR